jgi:hypothetical protein
LEDELTAMPATGQNDTSASNGDFVAVSSQEWLDEEWRFKMRVPRAHVAKPGLPSVPTVQSLHRLVRYELTDDEATIDVSASKLLREVDAGDWLATWPVLNIKGVVEGVEKEHHASYAELDAHWQSGGVSWRGRFVCIKSGPRMFLIACKAPQQHWDAVVQRLAVVFDSFEPSTKAPHRYAERLRDYSAESPIPWTISLPSSWMLEPGTKNDKVASFQAENMTQAWGEPGEMVGKMAFAVLDRPMYKTPRETVNLYLDAVRDHGIEIGPTQLKLLELRRPFEQSWCLEAPVWSDDAPGVVHCRVLLHENVWVLAGVLSVRREEDAMAWMQNKRAIDVVTRSLRFDA